MISGCSVLTAERSAMNMHQCLLKSIILIVLYFMHILAFEVYENNMQIHILYSIGENKEKEKKDKK